MMDAAREILNRLGIESVEEMAVNESHTIEVEGFEDLTIEKVGSNRLSVAHHYIQRGDLMSNPEVVFHIDGGVWTPVRYTQHPHVHQHDEDGLPGVEAFCETWSENLRRQGFVEEADSG
jgi:hypothetical protein